MNDILQIISNINGVKSIGSCCEEQINEAEEKLKLKFPEEYRKYLLNYGTICFNGVEICGLNVEGYLNVVEATEQEKSVNKSFPQGMFVVEDLGVDAKLIVSDEKGMIYLLQRDKKKVICKSFSEYIKKCKLR